MQNFPRFLVKIGFYRIIEFKHIEYLGTLRNKCGHDKTEEPNSEDVKTLIEGVEKIRNTIY
jgi:hypothetical protein